MHFQSRKGIWKYHWENGSQCDNTLRPRQIGWHFADSFKCIFLIKKYESCFKFHWELFPMVQLMILQHWFREWLGADQATSHHVNQWWPSLLMHVCVIQPLWVKLNHSRILLHLPNLVIMPSSYLNHQVRYWDGVQNGQNSIVLYKENIFMSSDI